ncbi:hypothetical protein GKZ28_06555 [Clostridium chromiireducens]|uniref:Uncharacterized protein n=1 Tax=Clostridium chromiireducens TaxID=225345 RepID=A0A964RKE8_9CLOT|nr:DUF6304 family protein [Clostridium chromiireducens]MVX63358.1 hypothetical protein [Clostridium chromiireducens]
MVKLKYSALYTDNFGCEQAEVYFSNSGFRLKVRNNIFENDSFNFEFYTKGLEEAEHTFELKDNELVEYSIDIKIPLLLAYNKSYYVEEFVLHVERQKNYYNNSLSLFSQDVTCEVEGYDLYELLHKIKKELPRGYEIEDNFSSIFGAVYFESNKENPLRGKIISQELDNDLNKDYMNLWSSQNNKNFERYEKIPITYINNEYCIS